MLMDYGIYILDCSYLARNTCPNWIGYMEFEVTKDPVITVRLDPHSWIGLIRYGLPSEALSL